MRENFVEAFRAARQAHAAVVGAEGKLRDSLSSDPSVAAEPGETADAAYALREAEELYDSARKKTKALKELAEKMCCLVTTTGLGSCGGETTVRTAHVTATPTLRTNVSVPSRRKDFAGWCALMRELGVPEHLLGGPGEGEHAALDVHWPGLMNLLARRQAEGLPLPAGVDPSRTVASYGLTIRKKKGVTE